MEFSFEAIGTHWVINIDGEQTENLDIEKKIHQRIAAFDKNYSRFRDDSLVTEISKVARVYHLPEDAKLLLDFYQSMYKKTDGLFTPLIGKTLEQAGYDKNYSLQSQGLTKPINWNDALDYQFPNLTVKEPALLDFGAAGKGYLIDIIGELIAAEGITSYTIDAGGDILHRSDEAGEKIRVGLEDPSNTGQAIGVVELKNQSIAGSAGNRRKWGEFHHIINPETLAPVNNIAALWVVADTAMIADGLATALYLKPDPAAFTELKFEYLILFEERTIQKSNHFPAEIFYA